MQKEEKILTFLKNITFGSLRKLTGREAKAHKIFHTCLITHKSMPAMGKAALDISQKGAKSKASPQSLKIQGKEDR